MAHLAISSRILVQKVTFDVRVRSMANTWVLPAGMLFRRSRFAHNGGEHGLMVMGITGI